MRSDGIGSKQDSGHLREDHLLHNHSQGDFPVVEAVLQAVGDYPLGKERCPALADVLQDGYLIDDAANLSAQFTDFLPVFQLEKR